MVTVETALALPTLLVVAGLLLSLVGVVTTKAGCADAARSAARSVARGEDHQAVLAAARATYPDAEEVSVERPGDGTVRVVVRARPATVAGRLPLPVVDATAVAHDETGCGVC